MRSSLKSAGNVRGDSSVTNTAGKVEASARSPLVLPQRDGSVTVADLIDAYMSQYAGRDSTRCQRLRFWQSKLGHVALADLLDDDAIYDAIEDLAARQGRYFSGFDAEDRPIFKAKRSKLAPATVNRYHAALSAVFSWALRKRIAPRGWINPCRNIERRAEHNEIVRFLSEQECSSLLDQCKRSVWPKLYLLVVLALTTGARRGELEALRWADIDLERAEATVARSKNGDPKVLPLVPAVVHELERLQGRPSELVFASTRRPDVPYNHVPAWHAALKSAGITRFRFHDLRHSCASYLAQNGATLLEFATVLGHRNVNVTRRYSHLATEHKARLIHRVLGKIR